jgi:signal peptidase II
LEIPLEAGNDGVGGVEAAGPAAAQPIATAADAPARRGGLFWTLTLATVVVDQITKFAVNAYVPLYGSKTIIPNLLDFVHVHNAGVAFGFMNEYEHPSRGLLTTSLAVLALAGIAYYARHVKAEERVARLGLSLILGGAVGNLVDRLRQGYVVDFVDVYWGTWHFWAFNVADAAITVGAILVFVDILFLNRHASHPVSDR